jgi:predicted TIM-barrel fold metal-dependent hydrolase
VRFGTPIIDGHVALGRENHLRLEEPELIARMDAQGIVSAIARPMGSELVVNANAWNARLGQGSPRVRHLATANPWYEFSVTQLSAAFDGGAVGLYLHPSKHGFFPTDPIVEHLLDFAQEVRWPVVFHTGTYIQSDVLAVAEVARRFPEITFVCDCAGFADMWFELPGLLASTKNVMLCTSLIWTRAIKVAIDSAGSERVVFGSGEPRDSVEAALRRVERLELSDYQQRAILRDNAARVFGLVPSPSGRGIG